jgi:4'-phosphopantetheinyl transferase
MQKSKKKDIQFGEPLTRLNISPLLTGEIHLWAISLNSDIALFERCKACLTDTELDRISFYNFEQIQKNYVISQGGLRLILSSYLNIEPQKIQIRYRSKGKPYTADDTSLYFNNSNSGKLCVYAISRAGDVGIDIEEVRPLSDIDFLIDNNFTEKEKHYINKNNKNRIERFFQFWTIKEAYLKAIGEGMRLTPINLEFSIENGCFKLDAVAGIFEQEDWLSKVITPGANYVGAVTYKGFQTKIIEMRFI